MTRSSARKTRTDQPVLLIGESAQLLALRAWAASRGFRIAECPEVGVMCVIVDDDALDGMCRPEQARHLALARELRLTCLSPTAGWEHLASLADPTTQTGNGGPEQLAGLIDFPGQAKPRFDTLPFASPSEGGSV